MDLIRTMYDKHYKKLLLIPLALLIFAAVIFSVKYAQTGDFINRDVSLKGGVSANIDLPSLTKADMESYLGIKYKDYDVRELTDFSTRENLGLIIDVADTNEAELTKYLSAKYKIVANENYFVTETGSTFGQSFYKDLMVAMLFAFLFMAITVFVIFRTFAPSMAVIACAFTDIIVTIALTSLIGIKLSPAGIITFLLITGYSIDSDILLTTRMLKSKSGDLYQRIWSSMKTGVSMTTTTIVAVSIGFLASSSPVLKQMFGIIFIAMIIDIIATYAGTCCLLVWYCKKKNIT